MNYQHHLTEYSEPETVALTKRLRQIRRLTGHPAFRTQHRQHWPFTIGSYDAEMIVYDYHGKDFVDIEISLGHEVLIVTSCGTNLRSWISQPVSDVAMMKLRLHL